MNPPRRPLTRSCSASMSSASATESSGSRKRSLEEEGRSSKNHQINLNIAGPDGVTCTFKIPVDMPMHRLLKRYCEYKNLEYLAMEFLDQEGRRVLVRRTPDELHMADGDEITALVYSGGA